LSRPIVFLTDYGLEDEFVGVCKAVMARIAPDAPVLDLTHAVPAHDVLAGALVLSRSARFLPAGAVVLAVVDPGVGTARRPVVVESREGPLLVGPDNGLLSLAWEGLGGAVRATQIAARQLVLHPVSATFQGRDVFAPVAAHLAAGLSPAEVGPEVPVDSLERVTLPAAAVGPGRIEATVLSVDRFGNLQLSVRAEDLAAAGLADAVRMGDIEVPRAQTFASLPEGELGLVEDSWGFMALVANRASAAGALGLSRGSAVILTRPDQAP
jgi:hypothetical protein